jgi:hypothetical protein
MQIANLQNSVPYGTFFYLEMLLLVSLRNDLPTFRIQAASYVVDLSALNKHKYGASRHSISRPVTGDGISCYY